MAERKKAAGERQRPEERREKVVLPREVRSPRARYSGLEPTQEEETDRRRERAGSLRLKNRARSLK